MRKKSLNLLKNKTIIWIVTSMALAFIVTAASLMFYFTNLIRDDFKNSISISAEKKVLELNYFFNSAENMVIEFQQYILDTIDEKRILSDSKYEDQYFDELSKIMSTRAITQKGITGAFFRMEMDQYGPSKGIFLTGSYQKSFISVRPTDLSKFSPTDTEHVGWYYLPIWKKAAVWTSPFENETLRQKMIAYTIPLYKNEQLIGVVGIELSLAVIQNFVTTLPLDNSTGILLGTEQNLIHLNSKEELSKAVDRSAELAVMLEEFNAKSKFPLHRFSWDGQFYFGLLSKLENGMSYIIAVSQNEFLKTINGQIIAVSIAFIIVSIITTLLIIFALKNIIIPLKIVTRTTNRLARGELYIEIPYESNNEIGILANNIRLMTTQLKEYIEYISEQTKKEREAKEAALTESQINAAASQAKSAFLANMSHEIRTPINAVLGMNEMILRESHDKTILGYAANIKTAGANLLSIVNDVLDFSKIEAGKMELLLDNYEVSSLIIDLMNMTRERAQKKGLEYNLNIAPTLPKTLYGDSVRIKQCILNLLTNAIKYTKEGSITFTIDYTKIDENEILLTVHVIDTGCGIKKEDMKKLFTPFERIEEEKNRTIEGSGLGMSIVRRLLDMMQTKLDVKSTYGKGSDFSFTVKQQVSDWTAIGDLNEAYTESIEQMSQYKEKLYAPRAKLLFVDDTAMNLDVIKGLLKNTGISIDTVLSGKEALEAIKKNTYDILFIDHRMPEMDGIETLHAMKQMADNLCTGKPCIALTANAISGVKKMYLSEGFDDYLSKPVNPAKLEEMIIHYLPQEYLEEPVENILENQTESSEFMKKMYQIKELDSESALRYCGMEEVLISTMQQFYDSTDQKALELQQFYEAEDWHNYEIKVHSLKSTSRLIGAIELSKKAEYLEACATKNDIEEIHKNHKPLIDMFLSLKPQLQSLLNDNDDVSEKTEITEEKLSQKIQLLIDYADNFDIDGLDSIISELSSVKLPLDFSQKFDKIRTSVQNVDFKELRNLLLSGSNN